MLDAFRQVYSENRSNKQEKKLKDCKVEPNKVKVSEKIVAIKTS